MFYFGTNLNTAGHYFFYLHDQQLKRTQLHFRDIPFNPEDILQSARNGDVQYFHIADYSVCGIVGSCVDPRLGCKSVFFVKEKLTNEQLKERILSIPIAKRIIEQMPFKVRW